MYLAGLAVNTNHNTMKEEVIIITYENCSSK